MMHLSCPRVAAILLGACMVAPASAIPVTLNTTWLDANAKLSLSQVAQQTLALTGISVVASGQASNLGNGAYNLPVSKLSVDLGLFPPRLSLLTADVKGAALTFSSAFTQASASLANLTLDQQRKTIYGDVISEGLARRVPVFSFDVIKPLSFSLVGGISVNLNLGNLHFTELGASSFAAALKIPDVLVPTFTSIDFGTLDAKVVPWLRQPVPSVPTSLATALPTALPAVPEPSAMAMLLLGLAGVAVQARRKGART